MIRWDDIAIFLAVVREGTTVGAASLLKTSQPTVGRRIAQLERELEVRLFERGPTGLTLTENGKKLLVPAEKIERAMCEFEAAVDDIAARGKRQIRLTLLDHYEHLLVPVLREYRSKHQNVRVELLPSNKIYDLTKGEADIAIRGRRFDSDDELIVRQLPPSGWTIYCASQSTESERPLSPMQLAHFSIGIMNGSPGQLPIFQWLKSFAASEDDLQHFDSFSVMRAAISSGSIVSALPVTIGNADPSLKQCWPPEQEFDVPIFLVANRMSLRRREVADLYEAIYRWGKANPALFTGVAELQ